MLRRAIALCYTKGRPMTFVENVTPARPFVEDVDILAPGMPLGPRPRPRDAPEGAGAGKGPAGRGPPLWRSV